MSAAGVRKLHFIGDKFTNILLYGEFFLTLPSPSKLGCWVLLQHDNNPEHKCKATLAQSLLLTQVNTYKGL